MRNRLDGSVLRLIDEPPPEWNGEETRTLRVVSHVPFVLVELEAEVTRPHDLTLEIRSDAVRHVGDMSDGICLEVRNADGLRALGNALVSLAAGAEARGMFDALRAMPPETREEHGEDDEDEEGD